VKRRIYLRILRLLWMEMDDGQDAGDLQDSGDTERAPNPSVK